jgi:Flp pilus assembly protein TadD
MAPWRLKSFRMGGLAALSVLLTLSEAGIPRLHAQVPEIRTVTVRVAPDEAYRAQPNWEATLRAIVKMVSDIYEKNFQIRLAILDIVPWNAGASVPPERMLQKIRDDVQIGEADVLIGFSNKRCERLTYGWAGSFDRYSVVMTGCLETVLLKTSAPEPVLSHEVGHLLGAFHPALGVDSVMRGGAADKFDGQTTRVIRLTRNFDFKRGVMGLDSEIRRAWSAIYAEGHARDEPNPLALAIRNAALELLRSGKIDEAEVVYREAITVDPSCAQAHGDLGLLYSRRSQLNEAARELRTAKELDFRQVAARTELGLVLLRLGKEEEALWEFREVLRVEPGLALAHFGLGLILARRNKIPEAINEFREVARLEPKNGQAHLAMAGALYQAGRYGEAWEAVGQARTRGVEAAPAFLKELGEKMPPPAR